MSVGVTWLAFCASGLMHFVVTHHVPRVHASTHGRMGSGGAAAAQPSAAADSNKLLQGVMAVATHAAALQLRVLAASALAPLAARLDALPAARALLESFPEGPAALQANPNQVHHLVQLLKDMGVICQHASVSSAIDPC